MRFRLFPALLDHPKRLRFAEQEIDEVVELFLRQHWILNLPWILGGLLGLALPLILLFLDQLFGTNYAQMIPLDILVGGIIVWYLLITAYVLESFLHWYFNVYIITNKHLVDINFFNLLNRQILEIKLINIEGVTSKMSGLVGSFFNFGDVLVRTAAEKQVVTFDRVPNPDFVADRIQDLNTSLGNAIRSDNP